jgi:hypothetical protein
MSDAVVLFRHKVMWVLKSRHQVGHSCVGNIRKDPHWRRPAFCTTLSAYMATVTYEQSTVEALFTTM